MRSTHFTVTALLALGLFSGAACASPIAYSDIYSFGDSLSDVGNLYTLSGNSVPVTPPYSNGRFSNGQVWVENLADGLGTGPITPSVNGGNNFAYGGAQTGDTIAHDAIGIDLNAQLDQFEARASNPSADALYTLWVGANDVNAFISGFQNGLLTLGDAGTFIGQATSNVGDVVGALADNGLQQLLALDVPDLGKTPNAIAAANATDNPTAALAQVRTLTRAFNDALAAELQRVALENDLDLILGKTFDIINEIVANPQEFGLSNVTDPCWTGSFLDAQSGSRAVGQCLRRSRRLPVLGRAPPDPTRPSDRRRCRPAKAARARHGDSAGTQRRCLVADRYPGPGRDGDHSAPRHRIGRPLVDDTSTGKTQAVRGNKPTLDYVQSSVGSRNDPPAVDNRVMTHEELCHGDQSSTNAVGPVVV